MLKMLTILLLAFATSLAIAQEVQTDTIHEAIEGDLLMLSISYTSNNMKTKNYEYDRIPAVLADITYINKLGFTGGLNYTKYQLASQKTYEAEIQLGFQKTFFQSLTLNTYYARRKFVGDTTYEGLAQKNTIALSANYNWKFLDFQISNSYLNGKSNNYFMDLDLSFSIDFDQILSKKDFLLFNPTLSATFGTDYWIFQNLRANHQRAVIHYLDRHNFGSHQFDYQGLSVFIPVVYNIGKFGFIVNWFYSWPSAKLAQLSWEDQSGFLFSIYYTPIL